MIPSIEDLPAKTAKELIGIFFDIDDTFTSQGKIPAAAFQALWVLKKTGIRAVPITGRPAGWCDHIARMWPVDGVIGENGAFYFWHDGTEKRLKKRFFDPPEVRAEKRRRLAVVKEEILATVPGTAIASDQLYREADLAIDYCEDVPPLSRAQVERICDIFMRHGARSKVSSIHVNGWFGNYDKLDMTKIFVKERWDLNLETGRSTFLFCGDSPNDEPMFRFFPVSVGVRNVIRFLDQMQHHPAYVTEKEGGGGFAELVRRVVASRKGQSHA